MKYSPLLNPQILYLFKQLSDCKLSLQDNWSPRDMAIPKVAGLPNSSSEALLTSEGTQLL